MFPTLTQEAGMSPLRKQMDEDMVLRGLAERTRESYLYAVAGLAKHYGTRPDQLDQAEVQSYLLYLIQDRKAAWSSCNLVRHALKFFYRTTLKRREAEFCIPSARRPQKLPQILAREEIARLFDLTTNLKHRTILMTIYGTGVRLSEACHLRVGDIDSSRMTIRVEDGKGAKDRYTMLSPLLLVALRQYWVAYRPKQWLFTNQDGTQPISDGTVQKIFYRAMVRAGITKDCGVHGLRHAIATHLLEAGAALPKIQRLLGHSNISTTMRYLHLAQKHLSGTAAPLDLLELPHTKRR
jgi:site-specific recombinase XerD